MGIRKKGSFFQLGPTAIVAASAGAAGAGCAAANCLATGCSAAAGDAAGSGDARAAAC